MQIMYQVLYENLTYRTGEMNDHRGKIQDNIGRA